MVMAPRIPAEEVRRGRLSALRHPLQRQRILTACRRAVRGSSGRSLPLRGRWRMFLAADVLLWGDRAFVRGIGYFNVYRDAHGTWRAEQMMF
jgi:hypothetical protein